MIQSVITIAEFSITSRGWWERGKARTVYRTEAQQATSFVDGYLIAISLAHFYSPFPSGNSGQGIFHVKLGFEAEFPSKPNTSRTASVSGMPSEVRWWLCRSGRWWWLNLYLLSSPSGHGASVWAAWLEIWPWAPGKMVWCADINTHAGKLSTLVLV